jgi:hypothetical protein
MRGKGGKGGEVEERGGEEEVRREGMRRLRVDDKVCG